MDEWFTLPAPVFWIGSFVGGALAQTIVATAWRKAIGGGWVTPAVASMFTMQSCNGCGAAPKALPFHVVLDTAIWCVVLCFAFWFLERRKKNRVTAT